LSQGAIPTSETVYRLIQELNKLPGIGPKSAQRLTYYLLRSPEEQSQLLAAAVLYPDIWQRYLFWEVRRQSLPDVEIDLNSL